MYTAYSDVVLTYWVEATLGMPWQMRSIRRYAPRPCCSTHITLYAQVMIYQTNPASATHMLLQYMLSCIDDCF
jgi:hypothetical protein